jgi:hypothetical protein
MPGMHLVVVFGPPAVGKMTVGREICARTGYKLFHNHLTIEPFLEIFEFGSPAFNRLSSQFRRRVVEEAIASDLPGLVFTFVWGLELVADRDFVQGYVDLLRASGGSVSFVELFATLEERVVRNNTELRLDAKRSKRDRAFNDRNLLELEAYVMNTREGVRTPAHDVLEGHPHLCIDNTHLSPAEVADVVVSDPAFR